MCFEMAVSFPPSVGNPLPVALLRLAFPVEGTESLTIHMVRVWWPEIDLASPTERPHL